MLASSGMFGKHVVPLKRTQEFDSLTLLHFKVDFALSWSIIQPMKTIGIIGSRRRNSIEDYRKCEKVFFEHYEKGDRIVSGGCSRGGDNFAELIAELNNIPIIIHKANWDLGKHAGFLRNTDIARDADILICVVASDRKGGTEDTIFKAENMGKKIILVN